jgi:hypothetical protein
MTKPARVTQSDMARAVRVAHSGPVPCVVKDDGKSQDKRRQPSSALPAPWQPDQWLGFGKVD